MGRKTLIGDRRHAQYVGLKPDIGVHNVPFVGSLKAIVRATLLLIRRLNILLPPFALFRPFRLLSVFLPGIHATSGLKIGQSRTGAIRHRLPVRARFTGGISAREP